jgi:Flp pilus assembly protein TadB
VYWGAIMPSAYLVFCGWLLFTGHLTNHPIKSVLILLFGLLIFIMRWGMGRDAYKKKQEEELNKMKTQGI